MDYLLDTNICVYFIRSNTKINSMIEKVGVEHLFISEITIGELYYGAECSDRSEENYEAINTFCNYVSVLPASNTWHEFAKQKAYLRKKGTMIEDADIMIGATAIINNMILVTENTKHLGRLQNIKIENWMD